MNNVIKSVEELFEELNEAGVSVQVYSPSFFSSSYTKDWHVDLIKRGDTLKLEIHIEDLSFQVAAQKAYDQWHKTLNHGVREELGVIQIEHKKKTLDELEEETPF